MSAPTPTLDTGTRLALDRTRLAYERTMMAWVRTATSLISFGFTIYKFFQLEIRGTAPRAEHVVGPRGLAIIMIVTALVALALAGIQHRESLRLLKEMHGPMPRSVAGPVAALVAVLGVFALVGVLLRL
jgi:putative membrane protein